MNLNKKTLLIIIPLGLLALILLIIAVIYSSSGKKTATQPAVSPFPTSQALPTSSPNSESIKQGQEDTYFAAQQKKFLDEHPWTKNLPKRTDSYFVGYDSSKNSFFADIYEDSGSATSIEAEVKSYLTSIGVDLTKHQTSFTLYPNRPATVSQ